MGPTVWDDEGPMPMLKSSKMLLFSQNITGFSIKEIRF